MYFFSEKTKRDVNYLIYKSLNKTHHANHQFRYDSNIP